MLAKERRPPAGPMISSPVNPKYMISTCRFSFLDLVIPEIVGCSKKHRVNLPVLRHIVPSEPNPIYRTETHKEIKEIGNPEEQEKETKGPWGRCAGWVTMPTGWALYPWRSCPALFRSRDGGIVCVCVCVFVCVAQCHVCCSLYTSGSHPTNMYPVRCFSLSV
jgi:hypothetical protein